MDHKRSPRSSRVRWPVHPRRSTEPPVPFALAQRSPREMHARAVRPSTGELHGLASGTPWRPTQESRTRVLAAFARSGTGQGRHLCWGPSDSVSGHHRKEVGSRRPSTSSQRARARSFGSQPAKKRAPTRPSPCRSSPKGGVHTEASREIANQPAAPAVFPWAFTEKKCSDPRLRGDADCPRRAHIAIST